MNVNRNIFLDQNRYVDPNQLTADFDRSSLVNTYCLLINMPIREQAKPNNAPLGLCLLAAQLQKYGAKVDILDLNSYRIKDEASEKRGLENGRVLSYSEAEEKIKAFTAETDYDLIALSGLITTLVWQKVTLKIIKKLSPDSYIVSGGGLATEFREDLLNWMPELDGIAHSEGDRIILKIAHDANLIKNNKCLSNSEKAAIIAPAKTVIKDGKLYAIYAGGRPKNLDDIPLPDWQVLSKDKNNKDILENYINAPIWGKEARNSSATSFSMKRSINTVSSRGCPFACKFCFRGAQGERNYGIRSPENLFCEMKLYVEKYGIDFLGYVDDNFAVSRKRIFDLEHLVGDWVDKNGLVWGTHARLDEAADIKSSENSSIELNSPLRVNSMYNSGCRYIGFGAESASPRMLELMGKGGSMLRHGVEKVFGFDVPVTMMVGIKNTIEAGIHANCTWIMGYPGETLNDLKATVAFIKWQEEVLMERYLKNSRSWNLASEAINKNMFVATAYPGTEMFNEPQVREALSDGFGIKYHNGKPVCDSSLESYVEQLNDATDLIRTLDGSLLQYSKMADSLFLEIRDILNNGDIFDILDL